MGHCREWNVGVAWLKTQGIEVDLRLYSAPPSLNPVLTYVKKVSLRWPEHFRKSALPPCSLICLLPRRAAGNSLAEVPALLCSLGRQRRIPAPAPRIEHLMLGPR